MTISMLIKMVAAAVTFLAVQTANAQSSADSSSVLRALGKSFTEDVRGHVFLRSTFGNATKSQQYSAAEKSHQARLIAEVGAHNSKVVIYSQPNPYPRGSKRDDLIKYLSGFKYGYTIQSLEFSGNAVIARVVREDILYSPAGSTFSESTFQMDLTQDHGPWKIVKKTLLGVSDGEFVKE